MYKYSLCLLIIISNILFSQSESDVLKDAFSRFSKSPFNNLFISGGAFYSGDDLDRVPVLVNYYKNGASIKNMTIIDGLLGGLLADAKVVNNELTLDIPENNDGIIKTSFSTFSFEAPIMRFPRSYVNAVEYRFIDLSKKIISSNINFGKNWHTLTIEYRDRVDSIVFSAKSFRVRSYSIKALNNTIDIQFASYTNIDSKISYPTEFIIKSKIDKREIRFNVTNVAINDNALREAKKFNW